jgi:hypothetical protein
MVENVLAGVAVTSVDVLRTASLSTRDHLARAGVEFLRARSAGRTWDLAEFNNEAVRIRTQAENGAGYLRTLRPRAGSSASLVERLLHPERFAFANGSLAFDETAATATHPAIEALALALELNPREYIATVADYASRCGDRGGLFGRLHPSEVFSATIGRHMHAGGRLGWHLPVEPAEWDQRAAPSPKLSSCT